MSEPIFKKTLRVPKEGEKVYPLEEKDISDILKIRGLRTELDPGMGGVSPRVLEDMLTTTSELVSVDLAITSACNFKCVHCYRPGEEWGTMLLDFDLICKIIDQSLQLGVRFFVLTGGEPLMYSSRGKDGKRYSYFDVVDRILSVYKKAGVEASILTFDDVALIDREKAQMLADRKIALCLKRDILDHKIQNDILGVPQGSEKLEEGYEHLFAVGYGKNPDLAVSVNQVLRKGQYDTLNGAIDLHRWIRSNGMEHSVVPIHYCGEAEGDAQPEGIHPLEVKALYDILAEIDRREFNDYWKVYSPFPKNKTCNRPGRGVHVRATGKVTSCSESPLIEPYIFGNVFEQDFTEIIRSERFKTFKGEFSGREGKYICNSKVCDLNKNYLCRGGCATRSAYSKIDPETGLIQQNTDMLAYSHGREDPLCPGWVVLAQKQGVLKENVYETVIDNLLNKSNLKKEEAKQIREKIVAEFNKLKS